jgi:hypothetical protein
MEAPFDHDTARSRYSYIIQCAGCLIVWKSQLASKVALSTMESKYTGLSYSLHEAIPVMELLKEMKGLGFDIASPEAQIHCRVFKNNSGCIKIAKDPKYHPHTKHLNCKLHHFQSYIECKEISIHHINSEDQLVDYLTKPHSTDIFI